MKGLMPWLVCNGYAGCGRSRTRGEPLKGGEEMTGSSGDLQNRQNHFLLHILRVSGVRSLTTTSCTPSPHPSTGVGSRQSFYWKISIIIGGTVNVNNC
jgi:hypothetical protein